MIRREHSKKKEKLIDTQRKKPKFAVFFQDSTFLQFNQMASSTIVVPTINVPLNQPIIQSSITPAFLSRFPRSLSSLSLGGKKKSNDKDSSNAANISANSDQLSPIASSGLHHHSSHGVLMSSAKNKYSPDDVELRSGILDKNRPISIDNRSQQPPPLPQRNFTRRSQPSPPSNDTFDVDKTTESLTTSISGAKKKAKDSDLDNKVNNNNYNDKTGKNTPNKSAVSMTSASSISKVKKRSGKTKIKANSDPKISAHLFIQMERGCDNQDLIVATGHSIAAEPPPLPPRQPGMLEENQNLINNNKCGSGTSGTAQPSNIRHESRPSPNSLDARMNYPLIATATAVRDNISPFPLSNRPNIRQRLQQQQQQQNSQQHVSNFRHRIPIERIGVRIEEQNQTTKYPSRSLNDKMLISIHQTIAHGHIIHNFEEKNKKQKQIRTCTMNTNSIYSIAKQNSYTFLLHFV